MPKSLDGAERRKYLRINEEDILVCEPFNAALLGGKKSQRMHAFTKSLSEGGILFATGDVFDLGQLLKLEIDIPGWEKFHHEFYKGNAPTGRKPFVVLGKVIRVEDVGGGLFDIGVAFTAVDPGHRFALKKYVEKEHNKKKV